MPIYEYRCEDGHTFEVLQRMTDDPVTVCEVCGKPVQRVMHPVAIHFKGSGFYNTDYGKARRAGGDDGSAARDGSADGEGAKSDKSSSSDGSKQEKPSTSDSPSSGGGASDAKSKSDTSKDGAGESGAGARKSSK
ncbi:MAG TPA: zinc ribbon domain-containing protein [Solirubrobacteraceae bacterium]|nr:zinc ribbon domain-containing protein [Solirubrobacteraceae bacterium]